MEKKEVKLAPFHITQNDGNITEVDGVAATWSDIWAYQVPQHTGIVLQAGDPISCYLEDTAPAEVGQYDCYVKIEIRDPSGDARQLVFGPVLYKRVREFANRNTIAKLLLAEAVKVYPRQWIVLMAKDGVVIDASDSYFDLFTSRAAEEL